MLSDLKLALRPVEGRNRLVFAFIFLLHIGTALLEVLGIGFLYVFLNALLNIDTFGGNHVLQELYARSGLADRQTFVILLASAFVLIFLFRTAFFILAIWRTALFRRQLHTTIANRLLNRYIYSDYQEHLLRRSSAAMNNVTTNTSGTVAHCTIGILQVTGAVILLVFYLSGLLIAKPYHMLLTLVVLGGFAAFYWTVMHTRLHAWGQRMMNASIRLYKDVNDIFNGFKFIKVAGAEPFFVRKFGEDVDEVTRMTMYNQIAQEAPRLTLELIAVILILGAVVLSLTLAQNPQDTITTLAIFGVVLMRTMAPVSKIMTGLQQFRASIPMLHSVMNDYDNVRQVRASQTKAEPSHAPIENAFPQHSPSLSSFENTITFEDLHFSYDDITSALRGISLRIRKDEFVGLAGPSGSGKTTMADILLGLLKPSAGRILVDGRDCTPFLSESASNLFAYVPQEPFILDDTLVRNIAFGAEDHTIDYDRIQRVIASSSLKDVLKRLPEGLHTVLGERGNTLSGGERQRIGIARALYREAPVLILDEPTSALDGNTEADIAECIHGLRGSRTIIMIAHRLSTIQHFDKIAFMNEGRIVAEGSFQQLYAANAQFRKMVDYLSISNERRVGCAPPMAALSTPPSITPV